MISFTTFNVYKKLFTYIGKFMKGSEEAFMKKISHPIELVANLYGVGNHILDDMFVLSFTNDNNRKEYVLLGYGKDTVIGSPIVEKLEYSEEPATIIILPSKESFDEMSNQEIFFHISYIAMCMLDDNETYPIAAAYNQLIQYTLMYIAISTAYKMTKELFDEFIQFIDNENVTKELMDLMWYDISEHAYDTFEPMSFELVKHFMIREGN